MKVLIVYAHHNPRSFCHAVLDKFRAGLVDANHEHEVIDLHAIGFDPVLSERDGPNWIDERAGGILQRLWLKRWMGDLDDRALIRKLRALGGPMDVAKQQRKVAWADALVFVSPVYFVGFPAILKGWIERVFSLGFAFAFEPEAWRGDIRGRKPLLKHKKALILNTTIFDENAYDDGLRTAMRTLVDEFCLVYPGVETVDHVYFYAVHGADDERRRSYLDRAYDLGRRFG